MKNRIQEKDESKNAVVAFVNTSEIRFCLLKRKNLFFLLFRAIYVSTWHNEWNVARESNFCVTFIVTNLAQAEFT